ncbi:hypothetical protein PQX77_020287 [Marasmius sp. AFHP31]|nr:hypothetical protein PQX77_020287 [Marasmius sp. AFHP31]
MPQSPRKAYRWKPLFDPIHERCPGNDYTCPNKVSVRQCTGSRRKDHRGQWYESCEGPDPDETHFLGFRKDIDPRSLPEFTRFSFGNHSTNQELLDAPLVETPFKPYPPTPSKILDTPLKRKANAPALAVDDLFLWDSVPSTPSRPHTTYTADPTADDLLVNNTLAGFELDDLNTQVDCQLATGSPATPHPPLATPTTPTTPQKRTPPITRQSPSPWVKGVDFGTTNQVVVNGQSRNTCVGKNCQKTANPSKPAVLCSHLLCKSCCLRYQEEFPDLAFCKPHRLVPRDGDKSAGNVRDNSTTSVDPRHTSSLTRGRPLKEIHYQRRDQAERSHAERTKAITDRKQYEDDEKKQVEVMYWKDDGRIIPFTVLLSSFPWFRLTDIPEKLQGLLGTTVELFDPTTNMWKTSPLTLTRAVRTQEVILLRAPFTFEPAFDVSAPKDMCDAATSQVSLLVNSLIPQTPTSCKRKGVESDNESFRTPKRHHSNQPFTSVLKR